MEWININLPWGLSGDFEFPSDAPEYPHDYVNQKTKERFGETKEELFNKIYELDWISTTISEFRVKNDPDYKLSVEKFSDLMEKSKDKKVSLIGMFQNKAREFNKFIEALPEVILWREKCEEFSAAISELEAKSCFRRSVLNRPGVLIEVKTNEESIPVRYLIGDINELGGTSNDCTNFNDKAIVLRAKVLVTDEDLKKG